MRIYGIYDHKAEELVGGLQLAPTDGVAARAFTDAVAGDKQLGQHPEDFTLFYLGEVDPQTRTVTGAKSDTVVMKGQTAYDMLRAASKES